MTRRTNRKRKRARSREGGREALGLLGAYAGVIVSCVGIASGLIGLCRLGDAVTDIRTGHFDSNDIFLNPIVGGLETYGGIQIFRKTDRI